MIRIENSKGFHLLISGASMYTLFLGCYELDWYQFENTVDLEVWVVRRRGRPGRPALHARALAARRTYR